MHPEAGTISWLSKVQEETIDPERSIIDPHHHLWRRRGRDYLLEDLWQDTTSGHNITQTVFVECGAEYLQEGPAHEQSLGETTFVAEEAERSRSNNGRATISGIVGHVDLRLGRRLERLLHKHQEAGRGLFRGIRHAGAHALYPETLTIASRAPKDLYEDSDYRAGVRMLGDLGLTFDTFCRRCDKENDMSVYFVVQEEVHDPDGLNAYMEAAKASSLGIGKAVVVDNAVPAVEGDWHGTRLVILEFEDEDAFREWYESPEYQKALPLRMAATDSRAALAQGLG